MITVLVLTPGRRVVVAIASVRRVPVSGCVPYAECWRLAVRGDPNSCGTHPTNRRRSEDVKRREADRASGTGRGARRDEVACGSAYTDEY